MQPIKAAAIQFNHRPGDKVYNLNRVRELSAQAAAQSVNLAVFPEMCITGYWHVRNLSRRRSSSWLNRSAMAPAHERCWTWRGNTR